MNQSLESYETYLSNLLKAFTVEIDELMMEERVDEANHKKIERNVVDIFSKMFTISKGKSAGEDQKLAVEYMNFLDTIPKNWYVKLEKAKAHNDEEGAFVEMLKIRRKDILIEKFKEMM